MKESAQTMDTPYKEAPSIDKITPIVQDESAKFVTAIHEALF